MFWGAGKAPLAHYCSLFAERKELLVLKQILSYPEDLQHGLCRPVEDDCVWDLGFRFDCNGRKAPMAQLPFGALHELCARPSPPDFRSRAMLLEIEAAR